MMEIGKRSIFIGRMKLKDTFVAASKVDDLATAWRQRFAESSSGKLTDRGGMEFYEGGMAMVCDVDEERSSGLRKSGACRKRTCNYRYQAAELSNSTEAFVLAWVCFRQSTSFEALDGRS